MDITEVGNSQSVEIHWVGDVKGTGRTSVELLSWRSQEQGCGGVPRLEEYLHGGAGLVKLLSWNSRPVTQC